MKRTFEQILEDSKRSVEIQKFRQQKLELWYSKKDSLPFFDKNQEKIAVGTRQDDGRVKVVYYHDDGPSGDFTVSLEKLAEELRTYGFIPVVNFAAAIKLEQWSNTERWQVGLKQLRFTALVNALPWEHNKPMYKLPLDEAINYGNKKAVELGIEVY